MTDLRIFLGIAGYHRRFVKGFPKISSELHAVKTGKGPVYWNEVMEHSFNSRKKELTTALVLNFPEIKKESVETNDS